MVLCCLTRAPEILVGGRGGRGWYTPLIDIWSVGCIFGEMVRGSALFPGTGEGDTLTRICQLLGPPPAGWEEGKEGIKKKVGAGRVPSHPQWREFFPLMGLGRGGLGLTPQGLHLLTLLLYPDPQGRVAGAEALLHPYLTQEAPHPTPEHLMPVFKPRHEKK